MTPISQIATYAATTLIAYLFSVSSLVAYLPQFIALISIGFILTLYFKHTLSAYFISLLVNLLVFSTNGLHSPLLFLIYFLLFVIAFQHPPMITFAYSLVIIFFLSQSLNSLTSLVPLFSFLFISPLAWFIGRQNIANVHLFRGLTQDQTDIYLWLSLRFKAAISQIIDSISLLLSDPRLPHSHQRELQKIKHLSHNLLKSSDDLSKSIDQNTHDL